MEIVLNSCASVSEQSESGKDSVDEILICSPEERSSLWSILRLFDSSVFVGIFGIGIVSVSPFELPTQVVWVAVIVTDLIISDCA